ncbi:MAG: DoxX family protein [Acidobacteria bacterium]|nr:DoxX family protein [Acidobacteriota bacterium]
MTDKTAVNAGAGFSLSNAQKTILTVLRIAIGWHFLYEGVTKLFVSGWSAAPYLQTSTWVFSDFFHWIAATPWALRVVDLLNIWGLTLVGIGLMLGCFTRIASLFGVLLLLMYYLAHPPLISSDFRLPAEGRYFVINKNLIELLALCLFIVFPTRTFAGLDRLCSGLTARIKKYLEGRERGSLQDRTEPAPESLSRRELVGNLAAVPVLGLFAWGANRKHNFEKMHAITGATITLQETALKDLKGELPAGTVGNLKMSRLILGCNLIGGWAHARDLIYVSSLFKAYNTDRKVFETIELAEKAGINMMQLVTQQYPLFHKYCKLVSNKMQTMCQVYPTEKDMKTDIDKAIDAGATTLYVQGAYAERFVHSGRVDLLGKCLDYMKSQGYVAGIGSHAIEVIIEAEKAGLNPDYYVKTLHHDRYWSAHPRENRVPFSVDQGRSSDHNHFHDNMFDLFPEQTIEFMRQVRKPWVAFKILAGGAIPPHDGFQFAFDNGADFICVGMFDFQIVEDVNITLEALAKCSQRVRPWLA